jgi:hypothetical protein
MERFNRPMGTLSRDLQPQEFFEVFTLQMKLTYNNLQRMNLIKSICVSRRKKMSLKQVQ